MCLCHIRKTRSVIVPWAHIQPCPGHIYSRVLDTYNCALDTFYKRVVDTFKYVSLPHLYMEKDKNIDTFQALTKFSNHSAEEMCGFWQLHLQWELNPEPWGLYCITIPHGQKNFIRKYICYLDT